MIGRNLWTWLAGMAGLLAIAGGEAAVFTGGNTGAIPDNDPVIGRSVTFVVSGLTHPVGRVRLVMDLSHTWTGDVTATLVSPGGARLVVIGRVGAKASSKFGTGSDLAGTYVFDDTGGDFWEAASTAGTTIPTGRYRTSTTGVHLTQRGGCLTSLAGAFNGLSAAQANGTWTLQITDSFSPDTGSINSALLTLLEDNDVLYGSSFEATGRGSCRLPLFDYTGNGRSSYVLVRNTGGGPSGAVTWTVQANDGTTTGPQQTFVHGIASDSFIDGDFDGDGIKDAAIWRTGGPGQFIIRRSSRPTDAPLTIDFGQTGDDPTQAGDYDGDGIDDVAVYRAGASAGQASHTLIRLSSTGGTRDLVTGENGAFPAGGVDYTGDGRADMAVQANAGGGAASFRIYDGTTGAIVNSFNFGTPTDRIVVGNHSGDARYDITTERGVSGQMNWTTYDVGSGIGQPTVILGSSVTDFVLSGDYDGDGLDDYGVWRPSSTPGQSKFVIRPSTNTATTVEVFLGANGDYPVGNGRTH